MRLRTCCFRRSSNRPQFAGDCKAIARFGHLYSEHRVLAPLVGNELGEVVIEGMRRLEFTRRSFRTITRSVAPSSAVTAKRSSQLTENKRHGWLLLAL